MVTHFYIIRFLTEIAARCHRLPRGLQLYLFGSSLSKGIEPGDTDVLLVYPVGQLDAAHDLAMRLRSLDVFPPVEVIALSGDEEDETKFVDVVGAKRFWVS